MGKTLKDELISTLMYIAVGLFLAQFINFGLGYALQADKPIMAVVSSSMVPEFYKGDLILVKGVDPAGLEIGDIIVYQNPYRSIPVVHRIVDIEEEDGRRLFYTKGDHNPWCDQLAGIAPPIEEEWVRGKYLFKIPKLGWFKVILMERLG